MLAHHDVVPCIITYLYTTHQPISWCHKDSYEILKHGDANKDVSKGGLYHW
jgi:hypothetical protein